jgi:hypothetical protein
MMVAVAIVVMIIPVAVGMPTTAVFVPPPVGARPAVLTSLAQLVPRAFRLFTLPAVALGSFVQAMVGFCDAPLA